MTFDQNLKAEELNALWQSMVAHRSVIRNAMIQYAVKMNIDENETWKNPFRSHLDQNDDAILELQRKLTGSVVSAYINEYAPNVDVDVEAVLQKMVDSLTNEDTETTTYDKPLVFDAAWISEYLKKNYIENKDEISKKQLLSRVYHMIGDWKLRNQGRDWLEKDGTLVIPFYTDRWFRDEVHISSGTKDLMADIDRLIGISVCNCKPSDVKPAIFNSLVNTWSHTKPMSGELFRKHDISYSTVVDWIRPNKGRSEVAIHFKDPQHAAIVADEIMSAYKN